MTRQRGRSRSRWTHLALACAGLLFLAAGCLGENVSTAPTLEVDRPADPDEECPEVDVLRETLNFAPRLVPFLDHGKTWPIELEAGEAIEVSVGSPTYGGGDGPSLPDLRVADPEGALLLEKEDYSSNDHRVSIETDGVHEVTIENPSFLDTAEWYTDIHWYPSIECA